MIKCFLDERARPKFAFFAEIEQILPNFCWLLYCAVYINTKCFFTVCQKTMLHCTLQSLVKTASSNFCFSARTCSSCFFFIAFTTLSCCSLALVSDSERLNSASCWFKLSIVVSVMWSLLTTWKYSK